MRLVAALALVAVMAISPFGCTTKVVEIRQVVVTATPATTPTFTPEQMEYLRALATAQAQPTQVLPTAPLPQEQPGPPPTQEQLPPPSPQEVPPTPLPPPTSQAVEPGPKIDGTWRVTAKVTQKLVGGQLVSPTDVINEIWWISTTKCEGTGTQHCYITVTSSSGYTLDGSYVPPPGIWMDPLTGGGQYQIVASFSRNPPCPHGEQFFANVGRSVENVAQEFSGKYELLDGDQTGMNRLCPYFQERADLVAVRVES
jgi:hypothetical protein